MRTAKYEGYISVWARVHSTRVPNIIHHEGRGCKAYKDKRDSSFKGVDHSDFFGFEMTFYRLNVFY